jgi:DNA-binding HxlR family transcriptional regulator
MKTTPGNAVAVLPGPGHERDQAMRLYSARTSLYVRILDEVARHQGIRYNELVGLLPGGASKNLLTKALHRLQLDALLTRRGMGDRAGYELTPHGVAVRDAIVEYRALDRMRHDMPASGPAHMPA